MIEKKDLQPGRFYKVAGTEFSVAWWDGEVFRGPALKGNEWVIVKENHYEDGLPLGTAKPLVSLNSGGLRIDGSFGGGLNFMTVLVALNELINKEK